MTVDLTGLRADGDIIDLPDGRTLRLRIEVDQDTSVTDEEFWGAFAAVRTDPDYGRTIRPEGFDGNAEILHYGPGNDAIWWQPPRGDYALDCPRGSEGFDKFRQIICDLLTWGFKMVGLEVLDGTDAYGAMIVRDASWLAGVDDASGDYLAELVGELASELGL